MSNTCFTNTNITKLIKIFEQERHRKYSPFDKKTTNKQTNENLKTSMVIEETV